MSELQSELIKFMSEFREFKGEMREFKTTCGDRLQRIEVKLDNQSPCPLHSSLVNAISDLEHEGSKRQEKIQELKEQDIQIIAKLTPMEKMQLNLTSVLTTVNLLLNIFLVWIKGG
jgi:hypothetical protein